MTDYYLQEILTSKRIGIRQDDTRIQEATFPLYWSGHTGPEKELWIAPLITGPSVPIDLLGQVLLINLVS